MVVTTMENVTARSQARLSSSHPCPKRLGPSPTPPDEETEVTGTDLPEMNKTKEALDFPPGGLFLRCKQQTAGLGSQTHFLMTP